MTTTTSPGIPGRLAWRLAERPGRDLVRARSMLSSDLDVLEEVLPR